eukprot:TRINITY_DN1060_c0_g1_i3.p1 TRINITY_DN1060_c0_g1~~TRINITY_DN1060_c0_g1_i3.p1  ORF type:complete len:187 (-),score=5.86 TRINITY_DN1060_c0_g1_i3:181-741(-)
MEASYGHLLTIFLVGPCISGKSCFLHRACVNNFSSYYYKTTGIYHSSKSINVKGKMCNIMAWDTSGQSYEKSLVGRFCQGSHGILIFFNLSDRKTFEKIDEYYNLVKCKANKHTELLLVGSFCDKVIERAVTYQEAMDKAQSLDLPYIEVSAATGHNVQEAFLFITKAILRGFENGAFVVQAQEEH